MSLTECDEHNNLLHYHHRLGVPNYEPLKSTYHNNTIMFSLQGTPVDGKPSNIFARIIPGPKCKWKLTATPIIIIPVNIENQVGIPRLEYYAPYLFRIDPDRIYQWSFLTGLPWSNRCDAIWVVVDRLTKEQHLVPC
jgi:hypothetical protein